MKKELKEEILENQNLSRSERRKIERKLQKNTMINPLELNHFKSSLKDCFFSI